MSFGVNGVSTSTNSAASASSSGIDAFSNLNLTSSQEQQIDAILGQLQSGTITPDEARSQIAAILTPQQQQTLQSDAASAQSSHHHHHHHASDASGESGASDDSASPFSQLNLTTSQQTQINQLVANAQSNNTSPSDLLDQIDDVLTDSQKTELANLISAYTSSGNPGQPPAPSVIVNTSA